MMNRAKNNTATIAVAILPDLVAQDSKKNMIGEITLMEKKLAQIAVLL